MKVKVIKRYVDRRTKEIKEIGTIEDYEEHRAGELQKTGYVEILAEDQESGQ